jgi:hypothetical protein
MSKTTEIENRITEALGAIQSQEKPNIAKTAREFAVPYQRLLGRLKGRASLTQRPPNGRKLNAAQEAASCKYIDSFDQDGTSITSTQIRKAANEILKESHTDPSTNSPVVSDHWIARFLKRHPEYYSRRQRGSNRTIELAPRVLGLLI